MAHEHSITAEVLIRFAAGEATAEERRLVRDHLLAGCETCTTSLPLAAFPKESRGGRRLLKDILGTTLPAGAYDQAFAAAERDTYAELERRHLPVRKLLAELDRVPAERQELKVRNGTRYASLELSAAYVERSHEMRYRDPDDMLRFARLAIAAAEAAMRTRTGPRSLLYDASARAWGQAGVAHRVRSEITQAATAFSKAYELLEQGSGDRGLRAWMAIRAASFRLVQRDFETAIQLHEEAARLYQKLRDRRGEASALIGLALVRVAMGQPQDAIAPLQRCLPMLTDRPHDLDLLWAATQNLANCFVELGQPGHAYDLLAFAEPQFKECTDELVDLRVDWVKGKVERELGLYGASEFRLDLVREAYMRKDLTVEVAVVSLDLAEVYARQGRVPELIRTIGETIPLFQSLGVARELIASLLKLQEIAHSRRAAVDLLREVGRKLNEELPQLAR
ncbi:MAG TPA: tetratricopeptide repeat protein [Thermoanaerobaculia bacterium]|nr:tetratricopeptide repeat protein [Thermoanaerobaculia bacterium]